MSGYGERFIRATICLFVLLFIFSCLFTQVGFELKPIASSSNISSIVIADSVVVDTKTMIAGTQPIQSPETTASQKDELPLPSICDGFNYALSAALFQRPEPKAHSFWAKLCVSLEMIFVPLQAALLALAVRRRFMR